MTGHKFLSCFFTKKNGAAIGLVDGQIYPFLSSSSIHMSREFLSARERVNRPWLVWKALCLPQSQSHGHTVSVLAFSLTYSLKTHSYTHVAILVHESFRSLCLCNLSLYIGLDC